MKDFTAFKEALKDDALRKEFEAVIADSQAAVEFAAAKGYAVTAEEMETARSLTSEDLEGVAGGIPTGSQLNNKKNFV